MRSGDCLVLFVGTAPAAEVSLLNTAKKFNFPYVTFRWVGGAITNYPIISKRIEYLKKLRTDFATGALKNIPKRNDWSLSGKCTAWKK